METFIQPPRTIREVFLQLPEGTMAQLIDNNIVMSPPLTFRHQLLLNEINFQIASFIRKKNLGLVLIAPMDVYLEDENIFQPDILFISNKNQYVIKEDGIHGAPDLIIEILSLGAAKYDLMKKKDVYERSGVKEYWIVNPETKLAQGYFLVNGVYQEISRDIELIDSKLLNTTFSFSN